MRLWFRSLLTVLLLCLFTFHSHVHANILLLPQKALIVKGGDYFEPSSDTVCFLFKTNPGAQLQFYLGETTQDLSLVETMPEYNSKDGLTINGLTPGKTYYYQIIAHYNGTEFQSPVYSLTKETRAHSRLMAEWARTGIFYEIFVRSFADSNGDGIGDFKGLTQKISYLKKLGVNAVWLMPCFESPSYHGYDVTDYYRINPEYGTMDDFKAFLKTARRNGIKVILDLVVNHTSDQHDWFNQSSQGPKNPCHDYYVWADPFDNIKKGPWRPLDKDYYQGVFIETMPDLNFRNPKVREELRRIARFWLDPDGDGDPADGVDGFRLDATIHLDTDPKVTHQYWQEFNSFVKSINPNAFIVGETWADTVTIAPFFADMEAQFSFDLSNYLLCMAWRRNIDILGNINRMHNEYRKYSDDFIDCTLLSNHDQPRLATRLCGNASSLRLAASLLFTLPGTPFIYYGEELGQFGDKPDPHIREAFDWYASAKGPGMTDSEQWNGVKPQFTRPYDGISLEEQEKDPASLFNHYRRLIEIRSEHPILFTGTYTRVDTPVGTYGYMIEGKAKYSLLVVHNISKSEVSYQPKPGGFELLSRQKTGKEMALLPYETVILRYPNKN